MPQFALRQPVAEPISSCRPTMPRESPTLFQEKFARNRETVIASAQAENQQRTARRRWTVGNRWGRRRKIAAVTLALSGGLALRWYVANLPPVLPQAQTDMPRVSAPNAAHFYAAAADALNGLILQEETPLGEQAFAVQDNLTALALLRQGMRYPYQGDRTNWMQNLPTEGLSASYRDVSRQRSLTRLLLADARLMAVRGDTGGALNASLDALRFAQDIAHGRTAIEGMMGALCQSEASKEALSYIDGVSAEEARLAVRRLNDILLTEPTLTDATEAQKQGGLAALGDLFAAAHPTLPVPPDVASVPRGLAWDMTILRYGKRGITANYSAYMDEATRRAAQPYQEAMALGPIHGKAVDPISRTMTTWFESERLSFTRSFTLSAARKRVLLARLAVQAYRLEHGGSAPSSLRDLTNGSAPYLSAVPTDPFSPTGTEPLRYADGNVYSVGENGMDDGGIGDDGLVAW